jgi:transposase
MIVIGSDPHKSSHRFVAVDVVSGALCGTLTVAATVAGAEQALGWARGLGRERVWAIEDCRHVSGRLERALVARGERTVRVAPRLMAGARRGGRERGKSDPIDATAVARVVLREGVERLPGARLDERALEIRLLLDQPAGRRGHGQHRRGARRRGRPEGSGRAPETGRRGALPRQGVWAQPGGGCG